MPHYQMRIDTISNGPANALRTEVDLGSSTQNREKIEPMADETRLDDRAAKLDAIRNLVRTGLYQVSPQILSEALLNKAHEGHAPELLFLLEES